MDHIRTDLAVELSETLERKPRGVRVEEYKAGNEFPCTKVYIETEEGSRQMGKPIGRYFTIDAGDLSSMSRNELHEVAEYAAELLRDVLEGVDYEKAFVIGLGNHNITPDALGPKVCDEVFVTSHIKEHLPELLGDGYADICALSPGVMGMTGIETEEVARGIAHAEEPDIIIAIDALASRKTDRIGSSIQISDAGIAPGSGLGNHRRALNEEYLGRKVISIGIPMVTYASVIAWDLLEQTMNNISDQEANQFIGAIQASNGADLVVTPKNVDIIVTKCATVIAMTINRALNRGFDAEFVAELQDL